ncbi:MAG: hypothetical protein ACFFDT_18355 [Candidatus Hodarchaeota archaeon]
MEFLNFLLKCSLQASSLSPKKKEKLIKMPNKDLEETLRSLLSELIKKELKPEAEKTPYPCIKELIAYTLVKQWDINDEKFYNDVIMILDTMILDTIKG